MTLGILVLNKVISIVSNPQYIHSMTPNTLVHGILLAPCAFAVLHNIRAKQHAEKWNKYQTWYLVIKFLTLGVSFVMLTFGLLTWRVFSLPETWNHIVWLRYQAALLGHIILAISLLLLGRITLAKQNIHILAGFLASGYGIQGHRFERTTTLRGENKYRLHKPDTSRRKL